jgi:hypothetical protein
MIADVDEKWRGHRLQFEMGWGQFMVKLDTRTEEVFHIVGQCFDQLAMGQRVCPDLMFAPKVYSKGLWRVHV